MNGYRSINHFDTGCIHPRVKK